MIGRVVTSDQADFQAIYLQMWASEKVTAKNKRALRERNTGKFARLGFKWNGPQHSSLSGKSPPQPVQNSDGSWDMMSEDALVLTFLSEKPHTTSTRLVSTAIKILGHNSAYNSLRRLQRHGLVDNESNRVGQVRQLNWFLTDVGLAERERRRALRSD